MPEWLDKSPNLPRRGVIGVVTRDDEYLMIRRAPGIRKGGCWCFPGGHIKAGETSRQAIQRELVEELNIRVEPISRLKAIRVPDGNYVLAVWRLRHVSGEIRPAPDEVADYRWLTAAELRTVQPGLPSNEQVFRMLGA